MDSSALAEKLRKENLISEASYSKLNAVANGRFFSLNFELKTLLYAGVLLLTGGLGIAVYKNIDSIGHLAVILIIAAASLACFVYCYKKRVAWSNEKVTSPNIFFDYVLLGGCLTFLSFTGYLQYQYAVFGDYHGLAFLLPGILFFAAAYFFDHLGVLSMAITCIAAFAGITITPTTLLSENNFSSARLIYSGLALGLLLVLTARNLSGKNIKRHFTFTYFNFAAHLLFVSCLAGLFSLDMHFLFMLVLAVLVFACIMHANREHSFYFLLVTAIYGYIGITYLFFHFLWKIMDAAIITISPFYLIGTSLLMINYLKRFRKKIKSHADLQ